MVLPKHVGIIYSDVKREYFPTEEQYLTEKDAEHDAKLIGTYLDRMGIDFTLYPADEALVENLRKKKPEMVFNLVDSVKGNEYLSSSIPGVLELVDIPYTGAGILGLSLTYNKFVTKKLLQQYGIPVPYYQLFTTPNDPLDTALRFPLISKLNEIHGGVEMTKDAVSENEKQLRERVKKLITTYDQPVLVEEYIVGREIVAMYVAGQNRRVYCAEKIFNKPGEKFIFTTFDDQWTHGYNTFHYQKYSDPLLNDYVRRAFYGIKMADYGKFDIRQDNSGRYFFIDSNCNPAFGPKEAECAISNILDLYGVSFTEILRRLLLDTIAAQSNNAI